MSISRIDGVRIAGIGSAVPRNTIETASYGEIFGESEIPKVIKGTGVERRRVSPPGMCTSDLCWAAAENLLTELNWDRSTVDSLIFVSQTADYVLPATSCLLQYRLGLSTNCAAFDVSLGCSGYIYGMWLASHLVASGSSKRCLLAVGEVASRRIGPHDRSAVVLFGDAGTVTALEPTSKTADSEWVFNLGTDGSGGRHLIVPAGGVRLLPSEQTSVVQAYQDGNKRSRNDLYMNGTEVFLFTLNRVPDLIEGTEAAIGWMREQCDSFVFHQANEFMLKHLAKTLRLPSDKFPLILRDFGNTSSASIPLTLTEKLAPQLRSGQLNLMLAGFGVGLSWGALALRSQPMIVPPLCEVDESVIPKSILPVVK